MRTILYGILLVPLYLLSILPFANLYGMSNMLALIAYRVIGYRKQVVLTNLQNAFPEKSKEEIEVIARQFYRNLCDILVEDIKFLSISRNEVKNRFRFLNAEVLTPYYQNRQSVIMTLGHCGNWELAGIAASVSLSHQSIAIYRPLSNKPFEKLINHIRSRFGLQLVSQNQLRPMLKTLNDGNNLYEFITDQTPVDTRACHWMDFLNQDTPVYMGTEKVAKMTGLPVFFADIKRIKRGYYQATFHEITSNPGNTTAGEITEKHTRLLERSIREQPDNWLWSHRRWKRKRPADVLNKAVEKV